MSKLQKQSLSKMLALFSIVGMIALVSFANADKVKIAGGPLKGGTIKASSGDEAGTLKGVIHMRMNNSGGVIPDNLTITIELSLAAGRIREAPMKMRLKAVVPENQKFPIDWTVVGQQGEFRLMQNGKIVDRTKMPTVNQDRDIMVRIESSIFDTDKYPYKGWDLNATIENMLGAESRGEPVIKIPIVVTTPGPAVPIPYPKPPVR